MSGSSEGGRLYRVHEFAVRAGVTVRTLHHYDRLGLLNARRTGRSYRVYRDADLPRLQQILVLKFLGLPLAHIAEALKSESRLDELLKTRRYVVKRKRARLAMALHLLEELDATRGSRDWADLAGFVRDVGGQGHAEGSWRKHRLDEAYRMIAERRTAWDATLQDYELNRDVRAALERGESPDTPAGQALVSRFRDAIERFVGGDGKLREALAIVATDQPTPAGMAGYQQFFQRALRQAS
jgi:DNA-binding transcriptional MerR regulator